MASISTSGPPPIARYAASLVMATILLFSGSHFKALKDTPTAAIRAEKVWEVGSSSGTTVYCDGYANCTGSGDLNFHALTLDGVVISTGSSLTTADADGRYVNTSGDTMTGALIINPTTPTAKGDLEVIGTISGATLQDGGNQVSALKCANFDVSGTGSNLLVSTGTNVAFSFPAFSGSIISVKAIHQTLGDGLTTYDVNINNVTVLSTKLTIDASESCSQAFGGCTDVAAAAAVISTNSFNQYAKISVDVDSVAGTTIPAKGVVNVCTLPDFDGYAPF